MSLNINERLHGFNVKKRTDIAELSATLYELVHERCGAKLYFLDREDDNKTFAITFKTIPEDSTGVFHIIEHSVLCGSERYPVKEPFVELLKSSLQTYLNAMTFPDKTMYPVATRNNKDFLNLISVYMDAVLHPAILTEPNIFRQEGWHYEIDPESGELTRSGVVLNEMRGAYSSADEVEMYHMADMLYPDTCYRHESGGMPSDITSLSYEEFVKTHEKYYHPSNSELFLDGSVELSEVLALIDSFLSKYERSDAFFEIAEQPPITPAFRTVEYEISESESEENKTRLSLGFMSSRFDEQKKSVALEILFGALMFTNESPLKKAILDSGLCEEADVFPYDSVKQNFIDFTFKNVIDGKCSELSEFFLSEVKRIADEGVDRDLLEASLNNLEFKSREKDYGTYPRGLVFAMSLVSATLYGGDGVEALTCAKIFEELRADLNGDYFEELLRSVILENEHRATLIMRPSKTIGAERERAEKEALSKIKASLSEDELEDIKRISKDLLDWQKTEDTPQKLDTLPRLSVSDISDKAEFIPRDEAVIESVRVITQRIPTEGIIYTEHYFDISDLTPDEIFDLRLLTALMVNVKTEDRSAIELQNLIKRNLGGLDIRMMPINRDDEVKIYAIVSASALSSKLPELCSILRELLYRSVYKDSSVLKNLIKQMKMDAKESFVSSGHSAGYKRALACVSVDGAVDEYYSGYEAYIKIKHLEEHFDESADAALVRVSNLASRIFTRERLVLSVTGEACDDALFKLVNIIDHGDKVTPVCKISPLGVRREGIIIPAQVAFASSAANLSDISEKYSSSMTVAKAQLTYGHLWSSVRVQGGAYGVGLVVRNNGNAAYYSYRDPSPKRSLAAYAESGEKLRAFAESGEDITRFIIGAIGAADPLTTPRLKGVLSATRYLRSMDYEDLCASRRRILATDSAELSRIADILDRMTAVSAVCVVGGRSKLEDLGLDVLLEI